MNKLKLKIKFVSKITIYKTLNVEENMYQQKIPFLFYTKSRKVWLPFSKVTVS